jgi:hypothetical protein
MSGLKLRANLIPEGKALMSQKTLESGHKKFLKSLFEVPEEAPLRAKKVDGSKADGLATLIPSGIYFK